MLFGNRVYLRRLEAADLPRTLKWINDPEIMAAIGVRGPRSAREQELWYERIATSRENLVFALCLISDHRHIGNLSLFAVDYIDRNAGLTIFIGEPKERHHGYGPEALRLLLEYGFTYLNLHRIYCKTNADATAAIKMYEKLGFRREGVLREHSYQFGRYVDKIMFGLLRREFLTNILSECARKE